MFSVSGRRPQENLRLLNLVEFTSPSDINNRPGAASGQLWGANAVHEFAVVRDTYGTEYGKPGRPDQYRHFVRLKYNQLNETRILL